MISLIPTVWHKLKTHLACSFWVEEGRLRVIPWCKELFSVAPDIEYIEYIDRSTINEHGPWCEGCYNALVIQV